MHDPDSPARAHAPGLQALAWLDANVHELAWTGASRSHTKDGDLFTREVVLAAYVAGRDTTYSATKQAVALAIFDPGQLAGMKAAERSLTDWQTDAVMLALEEAKHVDVSETGIDLLREAAALFREYEGHEKARAAEFSGLHNRDGNTTDQWMVAQREAGKKAVVNAAIAGRIEGWLAGRESDECRTCAEAIETRLAPCDECGAVDGTDERHDACEAECAHSWTEHPCPSGPDEEPPHMFCELCPAKGLLVDPWPGGAAEASRLNLIPVVRTTPLAPHEGRGRREDRINAELAALPDPPMVSDVAEVVQRHAPGWAFQFDQNVADTIKLAVRLTIYDPDSPL